MKTTIFYLALAAGAFLSLQSLAGPSMSGGTSTVAPTAPAIPAVPSAPGTPGSRQLLPNTRSPNQVTATSTMTTNFVAAATNAIPGTNGIAGVSNHSPSVTATVNPITNGIVNSNLNINGNLVVGDQAVTSSDRVLLTTLSRGVRATLGITPNGNLPVHFLINNGTVTVVGTVQSSAQSQGIVSQVQQTPGVLSVINDLHVASPFGTAQSRAGTVTGVFAGPGDHAFTAADQALLTTVQQQAALQLGVTSTAQMPVHFSIQDGVVGATGQVNSLQEKQAIIAALQRTRGVVRVVDNIGVINGAAGLTSGAGTVGVNGANGVGNVNNPNLPATSLNPNQSNTIFLNPTNNPGM